MKFYLSSYKLGNETDKLKRLSESTNKKFAYISNALDFTGHDLERRKKHEEGDMSDLRSLGIDVELLDLRSYFGKQDEFSEKLLALGGLYISGGNTFVLRQAMKLSGFDTLILEMSDRENFVYAGYSAGVCVLTPTLRAYAITDDAGNFPYPDITEQIWDGLGIVDFVFEPHYDSDHKESESTDKEIKWCIENKILFKAYRDGEVLIIE
jgi:dipeptidase E